MTGRPVHDIRWSVDGEPTGATARDSFLDAVKAIAIVRVIAWHTLSWWWLSWIGAMPAMFFAAGALLDQSVERHGYATTLRSRLRRLLLPFWVYGAFAVTVMIGLGWQPSVSDLATWVLPFGDPTGSQEAAGLWIPLWYLRAYLWFLVATPVLRAGVSRLGRGVLLVPAAATAALWVAQRGGTDIPLAVSDACAYSFFVLVGILYHRRQAPPSRVAVLLGAAASIGALAWWASFGPASGVVNESYPLQILVGGALLAWLVAAASVIGRTTGTLHRLVRRIGSRALSIYLWQGFGLLAADRLVTRQGIGAPLDAVLSLVVVVVVTAACVAAFGWVEDAAAGRPARPPRLALAPLAAAGLACVVASLALTPVPGTSGRLPPSGQAVVARGALIEEQLDEPAKRAARRQRGADADLSVEARDARFQAVLDEWAIQNRSVLELLGSRRIDATVAEPSGAITRLSWGSDRVDDDELVAWWSMTKTVTAAWLSELADQNVVSLDDPVARYLPEMPHGDSITLEQLARHQSGIPTEADPFALEANARVDLELWVENPRLVFEPGERFEYSRLGYFILAWSLEEATGASWVDTVQSWADEAGVRLVLDEELDPQPEPTHPGGRGDYRGRLWASGAIHATRVDSAHFFRWLMTEHLSPRAQEQMATFALDERSWHYGLGLLPLCPCESDGEWLRSSRYGIDALSGSLAYDEDTSGAVFITPDVWFRDDAPSPEFYELQSLLLDVAT